MLQENLREARKKAGMSQTEVARQIGCSASLYSYYEAGVKVPTLMMAKKIANVFGVTIDYLIDNEEWQRAQEEQEEEAES